MIQSRGTGQRITMRLIICSSLLLAASLFSAAWADSSLDAATTQQLLRLERKYFGHTFTSDSDEARAGRLEQLVFGEENAGGTPAERIQKISALSPAEEPQGSDARGAQPGGTPKTRESARRPRGCAVPESGQPQAARPKERSLSDEESLELKDYPHITALEQSILGKTFPGQPLSGRLARLESSAFGAPSMLPDFSRRTDALEEYAVKKLHQKPFGFEADLAMAQDSSSQAANQTKSADSRKTPANQPDYPHITALERAILGQTYAGQEISSRLDRLETTAFGQPSGSRDLSQRTDALDHYCQKTHKKPSEQRQDIARAPAGQQTGSGVPTKALAMVANTLLGVAGMGMGPMGSALPRLAAPALFGRQQQAQAPPVAVESFDEPAVFTQEPPPVSSRLLTKVGWCEVKTFGHTFQSMHLTDRLRQLSQQLDFDRNKSDFELMDDIGALIKIVQQRQTNNPRPIGSVPQPEIR